jgi:hypothetical protein
MGQHTRMRWDCERDGCFNKKKRLKFDVFADALPGRIAFSDVDGIVEISGAFLLLEWKGVPGNLPTGQHLLFSRLSKLPRSAVFVIAGCAESMTPEQRRIYWEGNPGPWVDTSLDEMNALIANWVEQARR